MNEIWPHYDEYQTKTDRSSRSSSSSGSSRLHCSARHALYARGDRAASASAFAVGWNIAILGPIATQLSHAYGVGLTTSASS